MSDDKDVFQQFAESAGPAVAVARAVSDTGQGDLVELIGSLRHMARLKSLSGWGANAQKRMEEAATALASLREERDAAKKEVEQWKEGWSEMWRKLGDGTLHEMHCNADHRKPVGESGAGCSCHFGRIIRGLRHKAETAEAESASLRETVRVLEGALHECASYVNTSDERGNINDREAAAVAKATALLNEPTSQETK